jgi:signal transduction histidine kinase
MKKNSLTIKTLFIISTFIILLLLLLWVAEIQLSSKFYEVHQMEKVKYVADLIDSSNADFLDLTLEQYAYKYDMCIEYYDDNEYSSYNTKINDCLLDNASQDISEYESTLSSESGNYMSIYSNDSRIRTVLYYVNAGTNKHVFINAPLEDHNSSSYILSGHLIYIIIAVMVLSVIVSIFISRFLNRPIIKLTQEAKKLGKGVPVNFEKSNITEIDELANVLTVAASEMNKTDELRRDLVANVSHDLKTPLTMIRAYAEKVRDLTYNDEEKRNKDLNVIIDETIRLNNLVNDLLDLSKIESSMGIMNYEDYDLVDNIKEIVKRYDIYNYKFILDMPSKLIINADKAKMEQVIYNLINNAIEHTGNDLVVKISIKKSGNLYKVAITDTGGTLKEEDKALVWNKYYKKEKQHKRNIVGTGLGLSIVKNILEAHDLVYGIDSIENKYTSFYFKVKKVK